MPKKLDVVKSKIVKFKKGGRPKKIKAIKFKGQPLEIVREYNYLGVVSSSNGSFKKTLDHALTKGKCALGAIWQVLTAGRNNSWDAARTLFESTVASTTLYRSGVW